MMLNQEITKMVRMYNEEQLRSFLYDDITELGICFNHGAYKAAIFIAGSILEAVLTDWVSEMRQRNYFEEELTVPNRARNNRKKRADLSDLIEIVRKQQFPLWEDEAKKASVIREKRNLIHVRRSLKEE